jgi:hypothetical protein
LSQAGKRNPAAAFSVGPGYFGLFQRTETSMFLFFSNGVGLFGSIAISILLSLVLLYACAM